MYCKLYLSDEGYGHIVRQRAITEELIHREPSLHLTLQTLHHADIAERLIRPNRLVRKFNNITWHKQEGGSPDIAQISAQFEDYIQKSNEYIESEQQEAPSSFILSDFVCEAFEIGTRAGIPSFGVAHFTWDWFFAKLYPPALETAVLRYMMSLSSKASRLYFPPFTPREIVQHYRHNAVQVPLILRQQINHKVTEGQGRFKVLIMDSGSGVLAAQIQHALGRLSALSDFLFFVSDKFRCEQGNLCFIPEDELMVDYIADMDLVIGRAGFNTISECIGLRTPMLLIGEAMNPEMNENIVLLKQEHLGSFISLHTFQHELHTFLPDFVRHEYRYISERMKQHDIAINGAQVVAADILNFLNI